MKKSLKYREIIGDVRRVVVKIGSRVLVQKTGRPDARRMRSLTAELAKMHKSGLEVVIVTSGAVGAGMEALGMKTRPTKLPDLQMAAAVG
ncbi:MAG: glutamate 5-kinase, partial [Kiritimatiellae bacterium]|nr:glutamate 5-kinase [Kiritimatiellia bacterium]